MIIEITAEEILLLEQGLVALESSEDYAASYESTENIQLRKFSRLRAKLAEAAGVPAG